MASRAKTIFKRRPFLISTLTLAIPLVLSAFTHLFNPIGFPGIHADESTYISRSMHVLSGGDLAYSTPYYDHPYFGQIFVASFLKIINFPNFLDPVAGSFQSIEMLYLVPRVLMGLLAVVDTLLIYKIAEIKYNRKVAFIASVLFAVMPFSWVLRRILLDNLLLPFLLASILLALYAKVYHGKASLKESHKKHAKKIMMLALLSGIFLGLAIFTKIPAITMIPLIGLLIFRSGRNLSDDTNAYGVADNKKKNVVLSRILTVKPSVKLLGIFLVPVILIPLIWPIVAWNSGELDDWFDDVLGQANRGGTGSNLADSVSDFLQIDPALALLGFAGLIFAMMKRDAFPLLWSFPFLIFFLTIGFAALHHLILIIPALCIAVSKMIVDLCATKNLRITNFLPLVVISALGLFGLIMSIALLQIDVNSSFFKTYGSVVDYVVNGNGNPSINSTFSGTFLGNDSFGSVGDNNVPNPKVYLIGEYWAKSFVWVPRYVFDTDIQHIRDSSNNKLLRENITSLNNTTIIMILDRGTLGKVSENNGDETGKTLRNIYLQLDPIKSINDNMTSYDKDVYPYIALYAFAQGKSIGDIEVMGKTMN